MARRTAAQCPCGAAYDSKGICSACGKKRVRSGAYCGWHSFWCVIGTLFLIGCIATNLTIRSYLKSEKISKAMSETNLAAVSIGSETVAEMIRQEYVSDDAVLVEDVEAAIQGMGIEDFVVKKIKAYAQLLRGESNDVVQITTDEIVGLVEKSQGDVYDKCMLVIEEKDKEELRDTLEEPLHVVNKLMTVLYGSPAMRALARWRLSIPRVIVDIVLLLLLLWRWMQVRLNAGKKRDGAFKGMGMTILIPSAVTLLSAVILVLSGAFTPDGTESLSALKNAIASPYWGLGAVGVICGVVLMFIAAMLRRSEEQKVDALLNKNTKPVAPTKMESVEVPSVVEKPAPIRKAPEETVPCVYCCRQLAVNARFCIYCGKPQSAPATETTPESETMPKPETEAAAEESIAPQE